ncbi:hypothetical protein X943_000755 [Babesia divergens]|uniref:Uncharacterized protein n=1 Tax=Babesia divergens TaxID=32595 RepID=A0AAD9GGD5_BABDI|nr:hypothetical protein X943_000755 [Babesia divergens]
MASQSIIPSTDKHEATENPLEGSVILPKSNTHSLFELLGNLLASLGLMKLLLGEPPINEVRAGVRRLSKPLVKIMAGTINTIRIPSSPTEILALLGHIEEQEEKRSESLGQTGLKGLGNLYMTVLVFMLCMLTVKIMICTGGPSSLKDSTTDLLSFSEDSAEDGSEALAYHSYSSQSIFLAVSLSP